MLTCYCVSCKWNMNEYCECPYGPTISDEYPTAAGFLPICQDFKEDEGGGEDG